MVLCFVEAVAGGRRVSMQKSKIGGFGRRGSKGQTKGGKAAGKIGKEKKLALKAGKRDNDSDSDYSYRSVVSAGGTRHVRRRRKRADGTYSDSASYHSSQDEEGEARRRRRRRDREHGANSAHSYYSVVSEGGTRHVRRRKRHEDGTYSASESYHSSDREDPDDEDGNDEEGETSRLSKDSGNDSDSDSSTDYSYASETSEGGTRYETKRKRIRDADGNVVGYGDPKPAGNAVSDTESVKTRRGSIDESIKNLPDIPMNNKEQADMGVPDSSENVIEDEKWPGAESDDKVPSEFSDATTDDDVDLTNMTEEEKKEYFAEKERKRQAREKRRREKYGSRYDEILKKKEQKRLEQLIKEQKEKDEQERQEKEQAEKERRKSSVRRSSLLSGKPRETPKSMVTYEKGTPREYGPKKSADKRDHGLGHESWGKKDKEGRSRRGSDSSINEGFMPKFKRETTMLQKLPPIPQGKLYAGDDQRGKNTKPSMVDKESTMDTDENQFDIVKDEDSGEDKDNKETQPKPPEPVIEVGADGRLRLKKKKIDLSELDDETLRRLGIDPSLSAIEIAKKLKEMFGDDVKLTIGGEVIGTKGVEEFDSDMDDDQLAEQEDLDLTTLKGKRRVNVLFKRGGSALKRHLQRIIDECSLLERAKRNLDERDSSIDFLAHYRLVDPTKIDGYAKAFVIEDEDYDTVINLNALQIALEGIEALSKMTPKQREYVIKVLHIDEATEVTFRMFSVVTALCERVTNMDSLSQQLLEICSIADIERKMELYKAMFYQNIPSYRNSNFITSESLKIDMIAGGLNWNQQDYVMEKMEPNKYGEISFLDYMCYIPLFLSLHDNICDNPLDMSNNKYEMPPRKRPPSVQRDINPLGHPLKKTSTYRMKARSLEVMEGKFPQEEYSKEYLDVLNKYARLPTIFSNTNKRSGSASSNSESGSSTYNMIY